VPKLSSKAQNGVRAFGLRMPGVQRARGFGGGPRGGNNGGSALEKVAVMTIPPFTGVMVMLFAAGVLVNVAVPCGFVKLVVVVIPVRGVVLTLLVVVMLGA
jgi:hypothetical protein